MDEVAFVRSHNAGVMTKLMQSGPDRRLGKPVKCHARKERVDKVGSAGELSRLQQANLAPAIRRRRLFNS
jgi:hypothetical protein